MIAPVGGQKRVQEGKREYMPSPEEIARVSAQIKRERAMKSKTPKKERFGDRKSYRNPFPGIGSFSL